MSAGKRVGAPGYPGAKAMTFHPGGNTVELPETPMGQLISVLIKPEVPFARGKPKRSSVDLQAVMLGNVMATITKIGFDSIAAPAPDLRIQDWLGKSAPGTLLERVNRVFEVSREQMAGFLDITPKTVLQREKQPQLSFADAERLARYTRTWSAAAAVFEDAKYTTKWMHAPNEALGGRVPFDLLKGAQGEAAVLRELSHIEYGLPV